MEITMLRNWITSNTACLAVNMRLMILRHCIPIRKRSRSGILRHHRRLPEHRKLLSSFFSPLFLSFHIRPRRVSFPHLSQQGERVGIH
ncbi:hypothetical protein BDN70DRAFT_680154 [Pholiota conissans]|uniref:Uncharacterized protein n=1 Tax=Pholiota conissans TaxID=109636 RepID=A0A9P5ZBV4_9AGAR|nr:hypothetical protein BDN70DRAFT_680154 [Pholiota conissans]